MIKKLVTGLAVSLVLALFGCEDPPETGTVVEKTHKAAYTWTQMVCSAYRDSICTVWIPITHHVDESWGLCLRNRDNVGCREVPPETWARYEVGEVYP